jgi:zinc protease
MRSDPPEPGRVFPFSFPRFEHFQLASGLEVYLAAIDRGPLVSLHLACPGGAWHDSPSEAGRATLTAELLDEGADGLSAMEIAARVDNLGGFLSTQADWNASWISLGLLSQHLAPGLDLLARIARGATFPDGEVERLRHQRLANLKRRASQPASLAADALAAALYPGTAYGQCPLGTETSVNALGRRQLFEFYRQQFTPEGSTLILTGDLDTHTARQTVEDALGDWQGGEAKPAKPIRNDAQGETRVILVDRKDAAQTTLRLGHPSIPRTHPDFGALQVLNSLLGGKFTSRINLKLREELGITYGANSSFSTRLGPGPFQVAADVDSEGAGIGIREIIGELHRLQDERVDEAELRDTKTYLLGVFPYSLQRIDGLASRLADLGVANLPDDYFDQQLDVIRAVDPQTLQELAQRHLQPTRLSIVAVGPAEALQPQLEAFGTVSLTAPTDVISAVDALD